MDYNTTPVPSQPLFPTLPFPPLAFFHAYFPANHNYNKIVKSDWFSTALISALIGQFNRTVRVMPK